MMSILQGLSSYNNRLYAAWKGEAGDDRLFFSDLSGAVWNPQSQIPAGGSGTGPSLAAVGNTLYAAWKGEQDDQRLFYSSYDGANWSAQQNLPSGNSSIGPALAEYNGKLYAMWKGEAGDHRIFYSCYSSSGWTPQATLPGNTAPDVIRIVSIPDIHLEMQATGQPGTWKAQAKWIANNQATYNLQAVLFVGDVQISTSGQDDLSTDMPTAWNEGFSTIDGMNLPYLVAVGNHDYDNIRDTTNLDQYIGYSRICQKPWWVGYWDAPGWPPVVGEQGTPPAPPTGNPSKSTQAIRVDVGSRQLLVVALEYFPRQGALDWAGGIISSNPACDVIILTHAYMIESGDLYDLSNGAPAPDDFYTPGATTGTQLVSWAQGFPNVHLVLCGHNVPSPITSTTLNDAHRVDTAKDGHPILGVYADYQYAVPPTVLTSQVVLLLELSETQLNVRAFNTTNNVELSNTNYPYSLAWT
jgi:hypothetical protein